MEALPLRCSVTDWSRLVPQPANQKALLASRVFVRHYPHQASTLGTDAFRCAWNVVQ